MNYRLIFYLNDESEFKYISTLIINLKHNHFQGSPFKLI